MLARLDGSRKASVVQFLYESELIATDRPVLDLSGADLSEQTSVADERVLDGPEALTGETTAQIGLRTPMPGQPGSSYRPGVRTPDYPPPSTDSFRRS